ncbi:hypothetical protein [Pseudomonas aestiva]|uniref:hypothetical protein n=1 Tax=Pseudomonas aestiva TaxID=3136739 RepID=UPI003265ED03
MNDEQFELTINDLARSGTYYADIADELRARDTAQREAVEAWKAAQAREAAALAQAWEQRDAAQAQLARVQAELPDLRANMTKALDLLEVLTWTKYTDGSFVEAVDEADEMLEQLRGKVVLKGLADQQEAQGAQAGDERIALLERELDRERERADMAEVELQNARAALATRPEASQFPAAAAFVRNMATDYANEHGWDDMGGLSFGVGPQGTAKMEHFLFLEELAEKLRTMTTEGGARHA